MRVWSPEDVMDSSLAVKQPIQEVISGNSTYYMLRCLMEDKWALTVFSALRDLIITPLTATVDFDSSMQAV